VNSSVVPALPDEEDQTADGWEGQLHHTPLLRGPLEKTLPSTTVDVYGFTNCEFGSRQVAGLGGLALV
jgi:hypothetical protein